MVCRKIYDYVRYDLKEIAFPSSLPDPPHIKKRRKLTLRDRFLVCRILSSEFVVVWDSLPTFGFFISFGICGLALRASFIVTHLRWATLNLCIFTFRRYILSFLLAVFEVFLTPFRIIVVNDSDYYIIVSFIETCALALGASFVNHVEKYNFGCLHSRI